VRGELVLGPVPRDERDPVRTDPTDDRRRRGFPEGRLDGDRLRVLQERVEARPAEHPDLRVAHELSFDGEAFFFAPSEDEDEGSAEEDEDEPESDEDEPDDESDEPFEDEPDEEDDESEVEPPSFFDDEPDLARLSVE
jgi:hypothetical protein